MNGYTSIIGIIVIIEIVYWIIFVFIAPESAAVSELEVAPFTIALRFDDWFR